MNSPDVPNNPVIRTRSLRRRCLKRISLSALATLAASSIFGWCAAVAPLRVNPEQSALAPSERHLRRLSSHLSEFSPLSPPTALPRCANIRAPEALLTPDPLLPAEADSQPVRVSFIVGSDGHVHSAFILNDAAPAEDAAVLLAVRQWRYRPALCNGVPTDSEAHVRFTAR